MTTKKKFLLLKISYRAETITKKCSICLLHTRWYPSVRNVKYSLVELEAEIMLSRE
jgi:hypothetical protein